MEKQRHCEVETFFMPIIGWWKIWVQHLFKSYINQLCAKICPVLQDQNQEDFILLYESWMYFSTDLGPHGQKKIELLYGIIVIKIKLKMLALSLDYSFSWT